MDLNVEKVRECTGCKHHVLTEDTWHGDCRFHPPQLVAVDTDTGYTTAFPVALGRCGKFEPTGESATGRSGTQG